MERKKTSLMILGVCALVLSVIGVSYAFWQLRLSQRDENNLTSSCFDVELINEGDPIQLLKAYPMLDSEGETLAPYTFTLKNKCSANVKYQINLESLIEVSGESIEAQRLQSKYIKEKLNEEGKTGSINILTDNEEVTTTIEEAIESYKLKTGYMVENEEKKFELRLWLRGDLTMEDEEAMNKTFASKITIVATYAKEIPKTLEETILALPIENENTEDTGATGIYKVDHVGAEITYTNDATAKENLQKKELRYAGNDPNNYVDVGDRYTTDAYAFFNQDKYDFYSKGKCETARNETLSYSSDNDEIYECNSTSNTEGLYFLEYKDSEEDDYSYTDTYSSEQECQTDQKLYQSIGCNIVQSCTKPEYLYSYTYTYQFDTTEYFSQENCQSANVENEGICKITHHANEPIYWRIIGLVNTPEGQRVKIVRNASIGDFSWDTSASNVNNGYGVNEWSQSDLMKLLNPDYEENKDQICKQDDLSCEDNNLVNNSLYWNGEDGKCYTDTNNTVTDCDFTIKKMPDKLKNMVDTVIWNTGSYNNAYGGTTLNFYKLERSSNTGKICDASSEYGYECNDTVERETSWKGKVGLIYSSDYGYATVGSNNGKTRSECINDTELLCYDSNSGCYEKDWLVPENLEYLLSPMTDTRTASVVLSFSSDGYVTHGSFRFTGNQGVRPSVYLKSDVFVQQGDGSQERPYVLEME